MSSIFGEMETLLRGEFSVSQLTGALDNLYSKGGVNKIAPCEAEKKWELLIQAYQNGAEVEEIKPEEAIAAIDFDVSISPYLGISMAKKKEFYIWCIDHVSSPK